MHIPPYADRLAERLVPAAVDLSLFK
jgi:hypothetical protein